MKKKGIMPTIIAVVLIIVFVLAVLIVRPGSPSRRIAQHMKLAERYLSELDYEKAIAEYQAVITIDSKNVDAYLGLADVYIGQGKYEDAMAILTEGYRETGDERLSDKLSQLDALVSSAHDTNSEENAELSEEEFSEYDNQNSISEDEMSEENDSEEESEAKELLSMIAESIEEDDWESVFDYMRSDEYNDVINSIDESEDYRIWETDGRKLGIYKIEPTKICGSYMVYIGDYQNDKREGMGYWFGYQGESYYHTYGEWKNDKPNGKQEAYGVNAYFSEYLFNEEGVVIDGLWDGTVAEEKFGKPYFRRVYFTYRNGYCLEDLEAGFEPHDAGIVGFATAWIVN